MFTCVEVSYFPYVERFVCSSVHCPRGSAIFVADRDIAVPGSLFAGLCLGFFMNAE